jgi:peptidoglycan/LPS O-acetylase OafA/YrhL
MPAVMDRTRFTLVDALRGIAALAVVLFHAVEGRHITALFDHMPSAIQGLLAHGNFGVAIFFVLSGFVISHSLRAGLSSVKAVLVFMLKRSIRLDPPYWAAIIIAVLFSLLASKIVASRDADDYSAAQLVSHLFYLQGLLGFKQVNSVFWTLCLEIQFYLIFALMLLTRSSLVMVCAFLVSLPWAVGFGPAVPGVFVEFWYGFLLGVGAYAARRSPDALPWFLLYVAVIAAASIYDASVFAQVCCLTAIVLLGAASAGKLTTWLNWRWLQFLGTISYSLYLLHNPVTGATFRVGYLLTGRTVYTEALWWIASLAACICAATLLWLLIERPSARLAKQVGDKYIFDDAVPTASRAITGGE